MPTQNLLNLKTIWRLYQILGKHKLTKQTVMERLDTVSKEQFIEMIHLIDVDGDTPFEKQARWTQIMMAIGLEDFAKVMEEMFNGK